jgi:Family of unknown function (DUF6152)
VSKPLVAALIGIVLRPSYTHAHHSYSEYDDTKSVEVEGKLVEVAWQNPHARILVESVDAAGARVTWNIESAAENAARLLDGPVGRQHARRHRPGLADDVRRGQALVGLAPRRESHAVQLHGERTVSDIRLRV